MLFPAATLRAIAAGEVRLAFRRWDGPRVKPGGRLRTSVGELRIDSVGEVEPGDVTETDARAAGFKSREALLAAPFLNARKPLWRVAFTLGPDPRRALRESLPSADQADALLSRLDAMRRRSNFDPLSHLALIEARPGQRASELAEALAIETPVFKRQMRRLKELGLTESLATGYRLSPRGILLLARSRPR